MTPDHYAALGLSPSSEDVVIRAAYLALIRRYHPDGNASVAAAARTRAINAAYAVLSDPERRAEYDASRHDETWSGAPAAPPRGIPGLFPAAAIALVLLLGFLVIWSPLPLLNPPHSEAPAPARATPRPEPKPPVLAQAAPPLDLPTPPPVADDDPPPSLDPPLDPLPANLAPKPAPRLAATPRARAVVPATPPPVPPKPRLARAPAVAVAAPAGTTGFPCQVAGRRGQAGVCSNAKLANLDRQQSLIDNQSLARADPARRARLLSSRDRFVARRDACRSAACASAAYLARMREVSEIMIEPPKTVAPTKP